jgi:predicted enzyme related to lactoylglutathione lyase
MKTRITQFTLIVNNQEAALDFYTNKVGFEKKTDYTPAGSYRWVTVGPKDQDLELALFEAGREDAQGWSKNWRPGNNPPIVMNVDDCRKAFDELKARGVKFMQAQPSEYAWGISATFSDPDGNLFSINQRPSGSSSASWNR